MRYEIKIMPADDSTEWYLDHSMIIRCIPAAPYITELSYPGWYWDIFTVRRRSSPDAVPYFPISAQARLTNYLHWWYIDCRLQQKVIRYRHENSMLIVVTMLKRALCSSQNGVPLNFQRKNLRCHKFSGLSFEPTLGLCSTSEDTPFN